MKEDRILRIYTDGGCAGNQSDENLGGWGAILEFGQAVKELYGSEKNTTNNRMEMTALLEALRAVKRKIRRYTCFPTAATSWIAFGKNGMFPGKKTDGRLPAKKPVENQDLWKALLPYIEIHRMTFYRVKGHVNLASPSTNTDKLYAKFVEWNGAQFSYEDFLYVTEKNNRADELANIGIDNIR